jgi:hypothetical protein
VLKVRDDARFASEESRVFVFFPERRDHALHDDRLGEPGGTLDASEVDDAHAAACKRPNDSVAAEHDPPR